MRPPRFTIIQLFLAATLIALVLGLFTAANRLGPLNQIRQLCFSPNGQFIAARYESGLVRVWRLDGETSRPVAEEFGDPPLRTGTGDYLMECIYFADDDRLIKVHTAPPVMRVNVHQLDMRTGKLSEIMKLPVPFAQPWNTSATGDGDRLYVGHWGTGNVLCCDIREGKIERQINVASDPLYEVQVSADGRTLAASNQTDSVYFFDLENDELLHVVPAAKWAFLIMALSPDGSTLVAPAQPLVSQKAIEQRIAFWNTRSGEAEVLSTTLNGRPAGMTISRGGKRLAIWDSIFALEIYDMDTRAFLKRLTQEDLTGPGQERADYFELSTDGAMLATSGGNRVIIWDVATGKMLHALRGSEPRAVPIAIFTAGFALWAAAWGIVRKRPRTNPAMPRLPMPGRSVLRPILFGIGFLAVTIVVLIEITAKQIVDWRDVRVSLSSMTSQELFSIIALPVLVAVLVRQLARRRTMAIWSQSVPHIAVEQQQPLSPPLSLKLCWALMVLGGLFAIVVPIAYLFLNRENMLWTAYYSLLAGVLAISRGTARDTKGLNRTAAVQAMNIIALDLLNVLFASVEWLFLRRASVKRYLARANASA